MYEPTPRRIRLALAALAVGVPLSLTGSALAQDKTNNGKGDERPETAPGQVKPDGAPAQPEAKDKPKAAKPAKDKKAKKAKPAKPVNRGQAKKAAPKGKGNSEVARQKTTICHATGSETNPYVTITISNAALKAHARHQDGEDIIPAPAAGCPKGADKAAAAKPEGAKDKAAKGHGQEKVTICHATGSATNPYVKITIAKPAVEAHTRHQDGRDIIPAPAGDCPATQAEAVALIQKRSAAPGLALAPATILPATAQAPAQPQGAVLGATAVIPGTAEESAGGVAGETATLNRESGADTVAATTGRLPFTGLDTVLLVIAGLALLLGGFALRRTLSTRSTSV